MQHKNHRFVSLALCLVLLLAMSACANQEQVPEPEQDAVVDVEEPKVEEENDEQPETPAAESEFPEEDPSLTKLRETFAEQNVMGGIMFLGYFEDEPLSEAFFAKLEEQGYLKQYPFLEFIPKERVAKADGGEIYCIVPADPAASVAVKQWVMDDSSDNQGASGELLYRSNSGAPFLVCGNVSDIMPNTVVSMMDSAGNAFSEYSPSISLKDGSMMLPGEEDAPLLLDCTFDGGEPCEVELYQGNVDADGFEVQTDTLDELNEKTLIQLMIDQNMLPDTVEVLNFQRDGKTLQLDLNEAFAEYVTTMGSAGEYVTVGGVVNTFLRAFDAENLILTVNGKPLETGHEIYDYALDFYQ